MKTIRAIVGLGNPGKEYAHTRHNMGFLVVDALSSSHHIEMKRKMRLNGMIGHGRKGNVSFDVIKPLTYMNESGKCVAEYLSNSKHTIDELIVVVDDMDLPFGVLRLREKGSSGGHNGLESIKRELHTTQFKRLRIGIGRGEKSSIDFVLGDFTKEEQKHLSGCIERAVSCLDKLLTHDFQKVVSQFHIKEKE